MFTVNALLSTVFDIPLDIHYQITLLEQKIHYLNVIHQFQLDSSAWEKSLIKLAWDAVLKAFF